MRKAIITKNTLFKFLKITTAFLAVFIAFSSCNKDKDETSINETNTNDNYYVKYVIKGKLFSDWTVTTPEGEYTKNDYNTKSWSQTYGPVKKGFKCEVKVGSGAPIIEIHVSKNQEPFALKVTKTGGSASYTIDF